MNEPVGSRGLWVAFCSCDTWRWLDIGAGGRAHAGEHGSLGMEQAIVLRRCNDMMQSWTVWTRFGDEESHTPAGKLAHVSRDVWMRAWSAWGSNAPVLLALLQWTPSSWQQPPQPRSYLALGPTSTERTVREAKQLTSGAYSRRSPRQSDLQVAGGVAPRVTLCPSFCVA